MPRGRPKGYKRRPDAPPPGPRPGQSRYIPKKFYTIHQILKIKQQVIELIESEVAHNITEAAELIGVQKVTLHNWSKSDPEWASCIKLAQEIQADRLEDKLDKMNNPIPLIFRLKKLRPEYRDNYKFDISSEGLERLLKELKEAAPDKPAAAPAEPTHKPTVLEEAEKILNEPTGGK